GGGSPAAFLAYRFSQSASPSRLSKNIDCVSAYAIDVGGNSWLKHGAFCVMLAKWAAWPPSWNNVVSPRSPLPIWRGSALLVKLITAGCHVSLRYQAGRGECMKPFSYLPLRSSKSSVSS